MKKKEKKISVRRFVRIKPSSPGENERLKNLATSKEFSFFVGNLIFTRYHTLVCKTKSLFAQISRRFLLVIRVDASLA